MTHLKLEVVIAIHSTGSGDLVWHFITPNNGDLQTMDALVLPIPTGVVVQFRLSAYPDGTEPQGDLFDSTLRVRGDDSPLSGSLVNRNGEEVSKVVVTPTRADVLEVVIFDAQSEDSVVFLEKTPTPLGLYVAQLSIQQSFPRRQSFYLLPGTSAHLSFDSEMSEFDETPVTFPVEPQPDWLQVQLPADKKTLTLRNTGTTLIESAVPAVVHASVVGRGVSQGPSIRIDPTVVNRGSMTNMAKPT